MRIQKLTRTLCSLLLLAVLFTTNSCGFGYEDLFYHGPDVGDRADELRTITTSKDSNVTFSSITGTFTFVIITDLHYGKNGVHQPEKKFLSWLDSLSTKPSFCICLGDIADHGHDDEYEDYADFVEEIEELGVPVLNVVGNHDLYNNGWDGYKEYCYPYTSFYKFQTSGFSFYALDSGSGSLGKKQFNIFKKEIKNDPLPKIICTHYPVYGDASYLGGYFTFQDEEESTQLISLFAKEDVFLIMDGHAHSYHRTKFKKNLVENNANAFFNDEWTLVTVDQDSVSVSDKRIH